LDPQFESELSVEAAVDQTYAATSRKTFHTLGDTLFPKLLSGKLSDTQLLENKRT
jgi:hypothetical protein